MEKPIFAFEGFLLNPSVRQLKYQNKIIDISSKGFDMLLYLIKNKGEIVEKDELYKAVWGDTFVEENNIHVQISALRRILGERRGESKFIKTVPGKGYIFVTQVEDNLTEELLQNNFAFQFESERHEKITPIAVLPFIFEPYDAEFDYLTNGITQNLIDQFSQLTNFKVIAFSAVKNYKNSVLNLQEIGFQLGVERVLQGTVSKNKDQFEINIELVNANDSAHIWGTQYRFSEKDFISNKNEISIQIAERLKPNLTGSEKKNMAKFPTKNVEAYHDFQKGKHILENFPASRNREKSLLTAAKFFRNAIKKDKTFALAYAYLGKAHFFLSYHKFIDEAEALFEIQMLLQTAFSLDTNLSEAFELQGIVQMFYEFDFRSAEISLMKANEINSNNAYPFHMLSLLQCILQKFDESIYTQIKAIQLDPSSISYNVGLANRFYFAGEYEKTIVQVNEVLDLETNSAPAFMVKSLAFGQLGNFEAAFENIDKAYGLYPSQEYFMYKLYLIALSGDKNESSRLLEEYLRNEPEENVSVENVATVYSAIGDYKKSLSYIEKALKKKIFYCLFFPFDPCFKPLRNNKKFNELMKNLFTIFSANY